MLVRQPYVLCFIELLFPLFAARTTPVIGKVLECHTVVLSRIIDVATDGAHILTGVFLITHTIVTYKEEKLIETEITCIFFVYLHPESFFTRMKGMTPREFRRGK